ncbi:MAG: 1-acyl-sn-glycerol-3-phosphate acyltransferase [Bacteroidetes bacterium]|nr:1-acyl-sn-glycerol-3-phosphate acyltransferase [Bacteroidota bacterium]
MIKNNLKDILNKAAELYDTCQFDSSSQHLSKREIRTIKREIKDIAANKRNHIIGLTKFLRPLMLPTAKRVTFVSQFDFSAIDITKNIVIYMPNHKSHLDEFIIGYKFLKQHMPIPITSAGENLFRNKPSNFVLRSYGAFKIRRDKYSEDTHYYRLLSSYLGASIMAGNQIMSFQEGTRPRDGKIGMFRKGIIGTIEEIFAKMKEQTEFEDILFVPIAINWSENPDEKKLTTDRNQVAEETDLMKRFINLKKTHSSRDIRGVYLKFGEPVSYKQFVAENGPDENNSYAIGICNEVRSRVVRMMPIFKEHLVYSSIQFLNKYNKFVKIEDLEQLIEVTQKIIIKDEINIIETDRFSIESQLELMEKRDIIRFNDDRSGFEVLKPGLIDYYANHVTSLTEERNA